MCTYGDFFKVLLISSFLCLAANPSIASEEKAKVSFGVVADVQYCDHNSINTTCYRTAPGKLTQAVLDINKSEPNFVIQLGDFVDRDFYSYDVIMPVYENFNMPRYHVLGNHDWATKAGKEKGQVPDRLGLTSTYYDFKYGGWRFIVLNSNDISMPGCAEGSPKYVQAKQMCEQFKKEGKPNGVPWCAAVGEEQLEWLKGVLAKASQCNERAIVFAHHSLLPMTSSSLWNTDEVVDLLEKSGCVEAYICGHAHDGDYASQNGISYVTIDGMVETPDKNAYALFKLYSDRIEIKGYGRVKSRTFPIHMNSAEINKLQK